MSALSPSASSHSSNHPTSGSWASLRSDVNYYRNSGKVGALKPSVLLPLSAQRWYLRPSSRTSRSLPSTLRPRLALYLFSKLICDLPERRFNTNEEVEGAVEADCSNGVDNYYFHDIEASHQRCITYTELTRQHIEKQRNCFFFVFLCFYLSIYC